MFKVIVAGSRDYDDYDFVYRKLDNLLLHQKNVIIISGACGDKENGVLTFTRPDGTKVFGVDGLGERYAHERRHEVEYYPAQWDKYGTYAGPIRNKSMATTSGAKACVIFNLNNSRGSNSMEEEANKAGLQLRVYRITKRKSRQD